MFRNDVDANLDPHALDEEELEASCDEGDSNDEDAEVNIFYYIHICISPHVKSQFTGYSHCCALLGCSSNK